MAANYGNKSPWYTTPIVNNTYLDHLTIRPVSAEPDDYLYTIEPQFTYRPDLLAYVVYDTPKLWWVFAQRNMDLIRDPIFDFVAGKQIFLPKKSSLLAALGL